MERVLICSERPEVCEELVREFEHLDARPERAACRSEWPDEPPSLVVVDLADGGPPVRETCLEWGEETALWALTDQQSADRLISALAAGCVEYLFYPVNPDELRIRWRKHLEERSTEQPDRRAFAGRLEFSFPSDVRFVSPAVAEVVDSCRRLAVTGSKARLNLRVAVGEAVSNAILYGNRENPDKRVSIEVDIGADDVRITVSDEGDGFDPSAVADPTTEANRRRSQGRGIFLLRTLMDEVRYNEKGNRVTLVLET